jgi:hypothetical protein
MWARVPVRRHAGKDTHADNVTSLSSRISFIPTAFVFVQPSVDLENDERKKERKKEINKERKKERTKERRKRA